MPGQQKGIQQRHTRDAQGDRRLHREMALAICPRVYDSMLSTWIDLASLGIRPRPCRKGMGGHWPVQQTAPAATTLRIIGFGTLSMRFPRNGLEMKSETI